jgi:hypothetical protein
MVIYQNKLIKSLIVDVFLLDKFDFAILDKFALKGETTRHGILTTQDKKTVSKRINILYENEFLILRKSTPFQNQPHKSTKYFGLSLKGFLASLRFCNVEDNYLTKIFLKSIKDRQLSKVILKYIKSNLFLIFKLTSLQGITFDRMKYLSDWLDDFDDFDSGLSQNHKLILNEIKQQKDDLEELLFSLLPKNTFMDDYVTEWYRMIEFYSIGWKYDHIVEHLTDSFEPVIVPKNFDYSIECDKIDWDNLDTKSRIEKRIELNRIINYQINSKN